ncbi:MAG: hypothetical protein Q4F07_03325 [Bacteroidales bacterium]|nr:hypothetical protein [Bacteroidales bacterium]
MKRSASLLIALTTAAMIPAAAQISFSLSAGTGGMNFNVNSYGPYYEYDPAPGYYYVPAPRHHHHHYNKKAAKHAKKARKYYRKAQKEARKAAYYGAAPRFLRPGPIHHHHHHHHDD